MFESLIRAKKEQRVTQSIQFKGFPLGLNTSVPAEMLRSEELSSCVDFKINPGGQLESRPAFRKLTTVPINNAIKHQVEAILNGTSYSLISDEIGKIYYLNGTTFTFIDALPSGQKGYLFPYNDICFVLDGGYIKYLEDLTTIKIAYDAGERGTQYDKLTGNQDLNEAQIPIGNGTNTRAAVKFTTQTWESEFTIPITQVDVKLTKVGSPSGSITCKLRKSSDDSILASKVFSEDASEISSLGAEYFVIFLKADVTTEMSSDTEYYCSIEYSGGDASNYIELTCLSDGAYGYSYNSSWVAESKTPIMKIYPSRPPKGAFGCVSKNRPWIAGSSDEPGYVYFGNFSHLDWSTEFGGGYVSTVDSNRNSFPVGALADLYGDLWVYGTQAHPFLCGLQGTSPENFSLPLAFQTLWTTQDLLVNIGNDLLNVTESGVDSISGVQQYGDIRTFSLSDRINNLISKNWTDTAFAKYDPQEGQIWIYLPGYEKVLIGNIKAKFKDPNTGFITIPWTEYSVPTGIIPTSFGYLNKKFTLASSGHLYYLDSSEYKDITSSDTEEYIWPEFSTSYINMPFKTVDLKQCSIVANSTIGGEYKIEFYTNGLKDSVTLAKQMPVALNDILEINAMTMEIVDAYFSFDSGKTPVWFYTNINCWSVMLKFSQIYIVGEPIFFNEVILSFERSEK